MKETTNQKTPNKGISSKTIGERRNQEKQDLQNVQKERETQSKITNTRTGNSHPKRRKHRKTHQRMVHTENKFKKWK